MLSCTKRLNLHWYKDIMKNHEKQEWIMKYVKKSKII